MENKEYKETIMSDQLKLRIISSCENLESFDEKHGKKSSKKRMRIAVVAAAAILMLTFSVSAVGNWDYAAVFSRLFGSSVDNSTYIYSYPELEVLTNTFEGLDISIRGVAATNNVLYVLFDFTATDGTIFDTTDIKEGGIDITRLGNKINLHNPHRRSTYLIGFDPAYTKRRELNGSSFGGYFGGCSFIDIPDGNELDNRMSLAFFESYNYCDYPGSTVVLSINSIEHKGKIVKEGKWMAKFTVPKQQSKEINLDVNQKTSMLRDQVFDYKSSDEYVYDEVEINNVKLNALGLEYTWTSDKDDFLLMHTFHAWIEMKDGSTVGYPDITEAAYNGMFLGPEYYSEDLGGDIRSTFNEPINMENVKAIHVGTNLVINVD